MFEPCSGLRTLLKCPVMDPQGLKHGCKVFGTYSGHVGIMFGASNIAEMPSDSPKRPRIRTKIFLSVFR